MIRIIHNPRCSKSRQALAYFEQKAVPYEVYLYLEEGLTQELLNEVLEKTGLPIAELIRTGEEAYKNLYKGKEFSESEWIEALIAHPNLLQRPIVIKGDQAVIARPLEQVEKLT